MDRGDFRRTGVQTAERTNWFEKRQVKEVGKGNGYKCSCEEVRDGDSRRKSLAAKRIMEEAIFIREWTS